MDQSGKTRPVAALSIPDAGTYLGVSSDTVRRLVRAGEIPHARIGNSIRIPRVDLEEYLQKKTTRKWERVDGRGRRAAG
ncbi:MAG: helix-turn-helix domain-containing protein [Planctomycetota bacterium]|jgi:excisionase family DNA binding protein